MLEQLKTFRSSVKEERICDLMETIADFGDIVALEFPRAFPDLPADEYKHTEVWHLLIGSTIPVGYPLTASSEVIQWMEEKIQTFIDSF